MNYWYRTWHIYSVAIRTTFLTFLYRHRFAIPANIVSYVLNYYHKTISFPALPFTILRCDILFKFFRNDYICSTPFWQNADAYYHNIWTQTINISCIMIMKSMQSNTEFHMVQYWVQSYFLFLLMNDYN